jgi:anti-sigma factor RsiW
MSTDHPWTESAASYALGTLDQAERVAFESHLAECPACRAEVQSYQDVVGQLGYHAPPKAAPPHLKARVLAEAKRVRPIGAPAQRPPRARESRLPWLAAAAMLLLGGMLLTRLAGRRSVNRSRITG